MEVCDVKNRKDQRIVVVIEKVEQPAGLVFVMHGLGGFKEQTHIETIAEAFREKNFVVVRFDTTNTLGESEGRYEDATITNYYEDLEDVIAWASKQIWYQEPFVLTGHSLGGICTALYAEKYPEKIKALAPVSPVVSGKLSLEAGERRDSLGMQDWKETGWKEEKSTSKPGTIKRLPWSHMEDRLRYDLIPEAKQLTMPVLLIVGENDTSTPPDHVKILYDALQEPRELHIIKDAPHTFREPKHLSEIKILFLKWIDSLL
jgi:alpha-beta hydrolase superfamily lysophospholipase